MTRLMALPLMVGAACVFAALYGAFNDQLSYTISPEYYFKFKFTQFAIPEGMHNRLGASLVGVKATWWMGLVIGVPIAVLSLAIPEQTAAVRAFVRAAMLVVAVTAFFALASLLFAVPPSQYHLFALPAGLSDPASFVKAGMMHNVSYLAGILGLILGLIMIGLTARRARKAAA